MPRKSKSSNLEELDEMVTSPREWGRVPHHEARDLVILISLMMDVDASPIRTSTGGTTEQRRLTEGRHEQYLKLSGVGQRKDAANTMSGI